MDMILGIIRFLKLSPLTLKIYFTTSNLPNINDIYHSIIKIVNTQIVIMDILSVRIGVKNKIDSKLEFDASYFQ